MLYIDGGGETLMIAGAVESAMCKFSEHLSRELVGSYH